MKFKELLKQYSDFPVLESSLLLAGTTNSQKVRVQLSRWTKTGKMIQLKRGLYIFSDLYQKREIYPPSLASFLMKPSYISMEKALEYHDLIPESVSVYTCVTTKRPARFETPLGTFHYQHIQIPLFFGYESVKLHQQISFVATPEKALLDLVYLKPVKICPEYFIQMRLQNMEKLDLDRLLKYARKFNKPKISLAAQQLRDLVHNTQRHEKNL